MRSDLPKVLHELNGRPMIALVGGTLAQLGFGPSHRPVYVVGYGADRVEQTVGDAGEFVLQKDQRGTGDAAAVGLGALRPHITRVLLVHGDEPLIAVETYREMLALQRRSGAAIVLLTGNVTEPHQLGRVLRDESYRVLSLVQENDLSVEQRAIREINFGAYVFDREFLEQTLPTLAQHAGGEYYLTDVVRIAVAGGRAVEAVSVPFPDEQMGINDVDQLARAEAFLKRQKDSALVSAQDRTG